ncbi:serine hydrolase domain-containing protein [Acetivibrio ethanolgignens]|uniref:Beta-lactamase-related domain-containing protein n=1 Tax=Acetivibrio ethanolgignens TaxID=290052 RepID=A0A0V8QC38_9FIRM|nr:serine hydrolase domain-containing protein [Acetivibrio ethanolgignens]KSV58157.1 hypothetical protein ASU35_14060 [Acetivibrio ethanolgignens]
MKKRFLKTSLCLILSAVLAISPTVSTAQAAQTTSTAKTQAVASDTLKASAEKMAAAITSVYGATSIQYALIADGEILLSGQAGYNNVAKKTVPTSNTKYGIGSISKIFTTLAVLKLVEQGKVGLDTPVVSYVTDFKMADSRYKDITVRMLLNHSSGLMGSTLDNSILLGQADSYAHDHFLEILSTQRLKAAPGAFSVYCNDGFTLAELLVERVSGQSFSSFISSYFTNPLGMTNTKTPADSFKTSSLAGIYSGKTKLPYESLNAIGAGGIYSTAEDLCRLSTIITSSTDLLSQELIDSMEKEEYKNGRWSPEHDSALSYGLGWDSVNTWPFTQYNIKALVKGGDTLNYHGSLIVLPEKNMAVAVLSSGASSAIDQIMGQSLLLEALKENGKIQEILPDKSFTAPVKTAIPDELLKYEGYYGNYSAPFKIAMEKEGTLTLTVNGTPQKFIYGGDNKFFSPDGSTSISFIEDTGNTYFYVSMYQKVPLLGQIAMSVYQGQKLTAKELDATTAKAWEKYLNKDYFVVSERYNSALYTSGLLKKRLKLSEELPNYIDSDEITDSYTLSAVVQIPGMYGRDLSDVKMTTQNKTVYLTSGAMKAISEDAVKNLSTKKSFSVTIPKTEFAKYYKISSKSANKTINVTLPKKASFAVYDKAGKLTFSSLLTGKTTAKLPKGGYIVFVGNIKATFKVAYK